MKPELEQEDEELLNKIRDFEQIYRVSFFFQYLNLCQHNSSVTDFL